MTSRYPASAVLMEMSALLKQIGLQASVQWAPRTANREADRFANGFTQDFIQPSSRVRGRPGDVLVDTPFQGAGRRETGRAGVPGFRDQRTRPSEKEKTATQETGGASAHDQPLVNVWKEGFCHLLQTTATRRSPRLWFLSLSPTTPISSSSRSCFSVGIGSAQENQRRRLRNSKVSAHQMAHPS